MKSLRAAVGALVVVVCLTGCGGSSSAPASTPEGPPNTGLPIAKRAQDVVDQQNQRTGVLEHRTAQGP